MSPFKRGYKPLKEWCKLGAQRSHDARIEKHNYGFTAEGLKKQSETMAKNRSNGICYTYNKGKTNVELYGTQKAEELRRINSECHMGKSNPVKGKTWLEYFGEEKSNLMKENDSIINKNRILKKGIPNYHYLKTKSGVRNDLGHYVRSKWEANICRIFNLLGFKYEYESKRCRFDLGTFGYICDWYLPDFDIYIELSNRPSKNLKLNKFKELFPNHKLHIIDGKYYKNLEKSYSKEIKNWEYNRNKESEFESTE